ncbi:MAG: peptidylprolyl isomerase [Bryobacterales bacterium]|nr:peptidylprolyl isomerase [Bryobacterales bacterium]
MFNVFRSRDKFVRITLGAILTVVAVTMVITLIPGFGTTTGSNGEDPVLAQIGGEKIYASKVQQNFQTIGRNAQIQPELMQVYFPQYFESMVQRKAARYQAEQMGLTVTDDEVLTGLMSADPQFFQNGQLVSKEQFQAFLAQQGLTLDEAIDDMKTDLLVRKLTNAMLEAIVVTPKEAQDEFNRKYQKAKIQYIAFPAAKFVDEVKPTDQELQQIFNANRSNYTVPAKTSFQVLVLEQDKVESTINLTDQQLRAAYASSLDNFRMPERVHVRHILISTEGKSDAEKKTLKAKAEDVLKQAKSGADFAALAKKYSDDKANAEKGGDLDWVVKGQMVPEFEAAAFALKPNDIGGVVTTQFGYHIIQALGREPARVKPFEEVKDGLAVDLRKQAVVDKMQMLGDQIHAALEKNPSGAAEIAKQYGAELISVPNATAGQAIPTLGNSPEIDGALASMKPNEISQVLTLPADRLAVVVLNSRAPARPAEFSEVADQVKQNFITTKSQEIAAAKAKEAADKIRAGEDIEKVAKSYKLDVTTTNFFARDDAVDGLGSAAYVADAFTKPEGTILGPALIQGRQIVSKVAGKQEADQSKFEAERADIIMRLKQQKAQERNPLFLDSIFHKLEVEGKAKIYPDAMARVSASYK